MPVRSHPDDDAVSRLPLHARVREQLRTLIGAQFEDGQKFFSEPVLVERFGIALGTLRQALGDLAREGLLVRRVPQGTFVRKTEAVPLTVRVIMPQSESIFLMGLLDQVVAACDTRKLRMRIHQTHRGEGVSDTLRQLDGSPAQQRVLLLGEPPRNARQLYLSLAKRGFRIVNVDTPLAGYSDAYVGVNNDVGMRLGMRHLMHLGHRRIVLLVNEPMTYGNTRLRVRSFRSVACEHGLRDARVVFCDPSSRGDAAIREGVGRSLASSCRPTALFAVSDWGAWVALKFLAARGLRVPADISVLGFDDDRASAFMQPSLSTLAQPIQAIAQRALACLIQPAAPTGLTTLLPPTLVVRESTGPAPTEKGERNPTAPPGGPTAPRVGSFVSQIRRNNHARRARATIPGTNTKK